MSHRHGIIITMQAVTKSPVLDRADTVQEPEQFESLPFFGKQLKNHPDYQKLFQDPCSFAEGALGLRSPLNLPDIERAIDYLQQALDEHWQICIVGDRDVDGVSSTALLGKFIKEKHKAKLELIVSDDGDDYGLSGEVFSKVQAMDKRTLLILLDMGTSHGPEVSTLVKEGKRVIILDHHQLHEAVPDSAICAFVNPQRNREQHPGHQGKIATVGLVFKFLFAFALSYINDWRRVYLIEIKGELHGFRCGLALGAHSSMAKWLAWEQKRLAQKDTKESWEYILLEPNGDASGNGATSNSNGAGDAKGAGVYAGAYRFSAGEWLKIKKDPDYASRALLAQIIESRPRLRSFVRDMADLAALGTLTDMVPLVDENRSLVRIGIGQALFERQSGRRPYALGYAALMRALGLSPELLLSRDLSWSLGPAVNAAGRMGNTRLALDLLLSSHVEGADKLARELVLLNKSRKQRTLRNEKIVCKYFEERQEKLKQPFLFCYHPDLEPGVSGIIATRLCEQYKKPVVYINRDGEHARGSARTWGDFNVLEFLDCAASLFIQFGGHPEASGFSIVYENIDKLEQQLLAGYAKIKHSKAGAKAAAEADAKTDSNPKYHLELKPQELEYARFLELQSLEPFGPHNPEPILRLPRVKILRPRYMREGLHVSFQVSQAPSDLRFIAWRKGEEIKNAIAKGVSLNLYGCLEADNFFHNWNGFRFCFRIEELEEALE